MPDIVQKLRGNCIFEDHASEGLLMQSCIVHKALRLREIIIPLESEEAVEK